MKFHLRLLAACGLVLVPFLNLACGDDARPASSEPDGGPDGRAPATDIDRGRTDAADDAGAVDAAGDDADVQDTPNDASEGGTRTDEAPLEAGPGPVEGYQYVFPDASPSSFRNIALAADGRVAVAMISRSLTPLCGSAGLPSGTSVVVLLDPRGACTATIALRQGVWPAAQSVQAMTFDAQGMLYLSGAMGGGAPAMGPGEVFVAKLDRTGAVVYARAAFSGQTTFIRAIHTGPTGEVTLVGAFWSIMDGPLQLDGLAIKSPRHYPQTSHFMARLDTNGDASSLRLVESEAESYSDEVHAAVDASGNILLAATLTGRVDFGPGPLGDDATDPDVAVAKLTPDGVVLWQRRLGDRQRQTVRSVVAASDGSSYLSGHYFGGLGIGVLSEGMAKDGLFFLKLDPEGEVAWTKTFDALGPEFAIGVGEDDSLRFAKDFQRTIDFGAGPIHSEHVSTLLGSYSNGGEFLGVASLNADTASNPVKVGPGGVAFIAGYKPSADYGFGPMPASPSYGTVLMRRPW